MGLSGPSLHERGFLLPGGMAAALRESVAVARMLAGGQRPSRLTARPSARIFLRHRMLCLRSLTHTIGLLGSMKEIMRARSQSPALMRAGSVSGCDVELLQTVNSKLEMYSKH